MAPITALAGVAMPSFVEGRSLASSLTGGAGSRRAFLLELDVLPIDTLYGFRAIGTTDSIYIENTFGGRELYDLTADPFELENCAARIPMSVIRPFFSPLRRLETVCRYDRREFEDRP